MSQRPIRLSDVAGIVLFLWSVATAAIVVILLMAGCHPRPRPSAGDLEQVRRTESAWREAGLGAPGDCLDDVRVVDVSEPKAERICQGRAASCLLQDSDRGMLARSYWLIVLANPPTRLRDIRHETLHALVRCVLRRGGLHYDPYDAQHTDPRVWESGGPSSVEQRARPL